MNIGKEEKKRKGMIKGVMEKKKTMKEKEQR